MELHAGQHTVAHFMGMAFHMDTLYMTWLTAAIVILITVSATRGRAMVPSGIQNVVEFIVEALLNQIKPTLGKKWEQVVSVLLTLFFFIFIGNELGLLPNPHILTSPTSDLNTTLGLALAVSFIVHVVGIINKGVLKHFSHLFQPFKVFVIINLMEEVAKPLTLAFRLFGNILAGEILMELLYNMVPYGVPIVWLIFSLAVGLIQAFIFTILTTSYLANSLQDNH